MNTDPATASTVAISSSNLPAFKDIATQTLLDSISAVKSGAAWVQGQIPDILTQFLHWQLAKNIIFVVFGLIGLATITRIITLPVVKKFMKEDYDGFATVIIIAISIAVAVGMVMITSQSILHIAQIVIAPKVYLLEYAADLIKNRT